MLFKANQSSPIALVICGLQSVSVLRQARQPNNPESSASKALKGTALRRAAEFCGKVEAGDPRRIRYGCSVPGLTRLASGAPADFRAGI